MKNIFENETYTHRVLREITLMRLLKGHENIVKLNSIMRPDNMENFKSINLVMEYCPQNLMNVIRTNKDDLKTGHIKYFTYEILKGLIFIHSKGIIHRDLKPLNILVTDHWDVKISDFGQSNVQAGEINKDYNLTKYVSTRYYRAPELYMEYTTNYTAAVDMWALGCTIAEFFLKTTFVKAETTDSYIKSLI